MSFQNGDLVWAKMKGFPPWPGLVSHPPDGLMEETDMKVDEKYACVYFFGTHNYGFIEIKNIKDYREHKGELSKISKSVKFKKACFEIEEYCRKSETAITDGDGIANLYPTIKLHKIDQILDEFTASEKSKDDNGKLKRSLPSPKKVTKKRKLTNFSDPDTTTPLDTMCQTFSSSAEIFPRDETSLEGSDEFIEEEEEVEEEDEKQTDSGDEATDSSSGETIPSTNVVGFIGLGIMGRRLAHKLIQAGKELIVWNRSPEKMVEFQNLGVRTATSPADVVLHADITFCCVSNGTAVKELVYGPEGVLWTLDPNKSFIDLSSTDLQSSLDIAEVIYSKGSRYMEVRLLGSKKEAEEGALVCLAAGDQSLHYDIEFFYKACAQEKFFMGDTGNATKFYCVVQSLVGVTLAGLAECMALADRAGLNQAELLQILKISQINCPILIEKASAMVRSDYSTSHSLSHLQNVLQSVIAIGEDLEQPTPVTATANEIFKHAKKVGYGGHDVAAVFLSSKF